MIVTVAMSVAVTVIVGFIVAAHDVVKLIYERGRVASDDHAKGNVQKAKAEG